MSPFHLHYTLTRRQRLRVELLPWLPAVAGTVGFSVGAVYLTLSASEWFLLLLALPPVVYRGLFLFALDIAVNYNRAVELSADAGVLEVRAGGAEGRLPLEGVFQVFRSGDAWTVLHLDGTVLTIPAEAIDAEQVGYLRAFARRAGPARGAGAPGHGRGGGTGGGSAGC